MSEGYISIYCNICGTYLVTQDVLPDDMELEDDTWYICHVCGNKLHPKKDWYKKLGRGDIEK